MSMTARTPSREQPSFTLHFTTRQVAGAMARSGGAINTTDASFVSFANPSPPPGAGAFCQAELAGRCSQQWSL